MIRTLFSCACLVALSFASPAISDEITLIVDRDEDAIEFFVSVAGETITPLFGVEPKGLVALDGTVSFEELRIGTAVQADWLIQEVEFAVGGQPTVFEAMSMMVHPKTDLLPFVEPVDGSIAMSVCNVPDPGPMALEALHSYAGFIAYPTQGYENLEITLPLNREMVVTTHSYLRGEFLHSSKQNIAPGSAIMLEGLSPLEARFHQKWGFIGLALLVVLSAVSGRSAWGMARAARARAQIS
ncbi:MAG: hypothetical protein AAGD04_12470 [Pseudomonadota bacterium]